MTNVDSTNRVCSQLHLSSCQAKVSAICLVLSLDQHLSPTGVFGLYQLMLEQALDALFPTDCIKN